MRKRILLAEASATVRGVAESVLRQNGFEVISVVSGEKALEVIEFSRPDVIVAGCELTGRARKPLYEHIQEDPRVTTVPLLLLTDSADADLPVAPEATLVRPFDSKEFLDKVNAFVGQPAAAKTSSSNPLGQADLEDDFLDAALGLDRIDVTDSEVMDKTNITAASGKGKPVAKADGVGDVAEDEGDDTDIKKVESLMIREDDTDIRPRESAKDDRRSTSASGKIEILDDQFGLIEEGELPEGSEDRAHDYEWFINEMQRDAKSSPPAPGTASDTTPPDLTFSEPSSMVDPVTPPPPSPKAPAGRKSGDPGVDQFISEFKREIEKIRSGEPEGAPIEERKISESKGKEEISWQDTLEKMTPDRMEVFSRQFISELSEKIAKMIAGKIDNQKLLALVKKEIIQHLEQYQKSRK